MDIETVDALIRIRFNGPDSLQDFDTFRYAWEFLVTHSRVDDSSVCLHRSRNSKEPQQETCEATEDLTSSEATVHGIVQWRNHQKLPL